MFRRPTSRPKRDSLSFEIPEQAEPARHELMPPNMVCHLPDDELKPRLESLNPGTTKPFEER